MSRRPSAVLSVFTFAMLASACAPPTDPTNELAALGQRTQPNDAGAAVEDTPPVAGGSLPPVWRIGPEVAQARFEETAVRFAVAARRLSELSYEMGIWADQAPSSNSHRLLECGASCSTLRGAESLVEWWARNTDTGQRHELHRGEFLAVFASSGGSRHSRIRLDRLHWASADSVLRAELRAALATTPIAWNEREQQRGPEFGWLLQAACRYDGAAMGLDATKGRALLSAAIGSAKRAATEAGTHELEGLSLCLRVHRDSPAEGLGNSYEAVSKALDRAQDVAFEEMRSDGQLYVRNPTFDRCAGSTCTLLADLSKQAHFFEWTGVGPSVTLDESMLVALARLESLATEAVEVLEDEFDSSSPHPVWLPLFASASSHSVHVAGHLESWRASNAATLEVLNTGRGSIPRGLAASRADTTDIP